MSGQTTPAAHTRELRNEGISIMTQTNRTSQGVSRLSERASLLGLDTPAQVEREWKAARDGWSLGTVYHCPFCDLDFGSHDAAGKHQKKEGHYVLRWDFYDWLPLEHRCVRVDRTPRAARLPNRAPDPDILAVARSA